MPVNITPLQRLNLSNHIWFLGDLNQEAEKLTCELITKAGVQPAKTQIFHNGSLHQGYIVTLRITEEVATNRHNKKYEFTPYHKEKADDEWKKWKMGVSGIVGKSTPFNNDFAKKANKVPQQRKAV